MRVRLFSQFSRRPRFRPPAPARHTPRDRHRGGPLPLARSPGRVVSVAVERDCDRRVAYQRLARLGIDAGGDPERRERVAALVERHRVEALRFPRGLGSLSDRGRARRRVVDASEDACGGRVVELARLGARCSLSGMSPMAWTATVSGCCPAHLHVACAGCAHVRPRVRSQRSVGVSARWHLHDGDSLALRCDKAAHAPVRGRDFGRLGRPSNSRDSAPRRSTSDSAARAWRASGWGVSVMKARSWAGARSSIVSDIILVSRSNTRGRRHGIGSVVSAAGMSLRPRA